MRFRIAVPGMSLYPGGERHWWQEIDAPEIARIARRADELGFDHLRVPEHIVMREDLLEVMGPRWVHSITTMAYLAGVTTRIRLAGLVVVPYHNPIELAKALSTLDYLSSGRLVFFPAVGQMQWEHELLGAPPYAERGAVFDEYMEAILELWTSDQPSFSGRYVNFEQIAFEPRPFQKPRPTIWMAGHTKLSVRRAARFADGWSPWAVSRARLPEMLEHLCEQPEFSERARPFDVFLNLFDGEIEARSHRVVRAPTVALERDAILEQVDELAALGVTMTDADPVMGGGVYGAKGASGLAPVRSVEEFLERMQWFAEEVIPAGSRVVSKSLSA